MTTKVVSYIAYRPRHVRGTNVKLGQTLYALRDTDTQLYFIWAYSDESFARIMANRVTPGNTVDRQANWRSDKAQLVASDRKSL